MSEIETSPIVVTLLVTEGNKPGEPIGSYVPPGRGRLSSHLVFMPRNAPLGKTVRVELVDTGKKDRAGRTLYRGVPAAPIITHRWQDNGDGTASQFEVKTDWLGSERIARLMSTKTLGKAELRPANARQETTVNVVLGASQADSMVTEQVITVTPRFDERVENVQLVWVANGEDRAAASPTSSPIENIGEIDWGLAAGPWRALSWSSTASFPFNFHSGGKSTRKELSFGELPTWLQSQLQTEWPVCACGRERVVKARNRRFTVDNFPRCEKCRTEGHCARCGKAGATDPLQYQEASARLVCARCVPFEKGEIAIRAEVKPEQLAALGAEAEKLLRGLSFPGADGKTILAASLSHITEAWRRDEAMRGMERYQWYYFTPDGVFGSKFPPAALQALQYLGLAEGDGIVELIAWLSGTNRDGLANDYFSLSQQMITGRPAPTLPDLGETCRMIAQGDITIGIRLRDSEQLRVESEKIARQLESIGPSDHRRQAAVESLSIYRSSTNYSTFVSSAQAALALSPPPPPTPRSKREQRKGSRDRSDRERQNTPPPSSGGFGTSIGDLLGDLKID